MTATAAVFLNILPVLAGMKEEAGYYRFARSIRQSWMI
jgi:hypothetical protein